MQEMFRCIRLARDISFQLRTKQRLPTSILNAVQPNVHLGVTAIYEDFAYSLKNLSEEQFNLKVEIHILPFEDTFEAIFARYKTADGEKVVVAVREGRDCEIRYFACKELFQLHSATTENETATQEQYKTLLSELTSFHGFSKENFSKQSIADIAAYFGAIELLMPSDRLEYVLDQGICSTNMEIAEFFRIPLYLVEQAIQPNMRSIFKAALELDQPNHP